MPEQVETIPALMTEWINRRNTMIRQHHIFSQHSEFLREVVAYGKRLEEALPYMNDSEWEALAELANSRLSERRRILAAFQK